MHTLLGMLILRPINAAAVPRRDIYGTLIINESLTLSRDEMNK